jgi:RNA polymerase sigma-70 factor (ECF subfamily)
MNLVRATLPPESQRIFEFAILQEKPAPEVAALVNSTPAAVRKAKSRILHRLREALGDFA